MKKFLGIVVMGYLLVGCATTETIKVRLDEIPRIEKDDYIIIAFEGYDSEKRYEAEVTSYAKVEQIILRILQIIDIYETYVS